MTLDEIRCPKCGCTEHEDDDDSREYYDSENQVAAYCYTYVCKKCGEEYNLIEVEVPTVVERHVYSIDTTDDEMMKNECGYALNEF